MADIQEQLIRASAIARLGRIVQELEQSRTIGAVERRWFAELLYPAGLNDQGSARLISSGAVSNTEGSAILGVLQEELAVHADLAKLESYVRELGALRGKLLEEGAFDDALISGALQVARRLRRHFLGGEAPTRPRTRQSA